MDVTWLISTGVQAALLIIVIIYTIETWRLRKQNDQQLKLFRHQIRLAVAPFLVLKLVNHDDWEMEQMKRECDKGGRKNLDKPEEEYLEFTGFIYNPTSKVARDVYVFVYDSQKESFLECKSVKEVLPEKETVEFRIFRSYMNYDKVQGRIRALYGSGCTFMFQHIPAKQTSYIAATFRDLEGTLYFSKREFDLDTDRDEQYSPGQLFTA